MQNIKIGDVVRLRSGGPVMGAVEVTDKVKCLYFDKDSVCREAWVPMGALDVIRSESRDWEAWVMVEELLQDKFIIDRLNSIEKINDAEAILKYLDSLLGTLNGSTL